MVALWPGSEVESPLHLPAVYVCAMQDMPVTRDVPAALQLLGPPGCPAAGETCVAHHHGATHRGHRDVPAF